MERAELVSVRPEIEKQFLVNYLPANLESFDRHDILQGYVVINSDGSEVRVRQDNSDYFLTIKTPGSLQRGQFEVSITESQFEALWKETKGKRITKTRYKIPWNGKVIELDVYHGELEGLLKAEVEFLSEREMEGFSYPDYIGEDVTFKNEYKSQSLATIGWEMSRKIPEYSNEEGLEKVIAQVQEDLKSKDRLVILVAGGSGSGKTVFSDSLKKALEDSLILTMDDYIKGQSFLDAEIKNGNLINLDHPDIYNLDLLTSHLASLKENQTIKKPIYDFKISEPNGTEEIEPKSVIILEGLFALDDRLASIGDIKVFIEVPLYTRVARRIIRDIERTSWTPQENLRYMLEVVEVMHKKYVQNTRGNADIIIRNE